MEIKNDRGYNPSLLKIGSGQYRKYWHRAAVNSRFYQVCVAYACYLLKIGFFGIKYKILLCSLKDTAEILIIGL